MLVAWRSTASRSTLNRGPKLVAAGVDLLEVGEHALGLALLLGPQVDHLVTARLGPHDRVDDHFLGGLVDGEEVDQFLERGPSLVARAAVDLGHQALDLLVLVTDELGDVTPVSCGHVRLPLGGSAGGDGETWSQWRCHPMAVIRSLANVLVADAAVTTPGPVSPRASSTPLPPPRRRWSCWRKASPRFTAVE